jgi:molybdate transport system substrate-binding protein
MKSTLARGLFALSFTAFALSAQADEIQVAVAANFAGAAQKLAAQFEHDTGHVVKLSFGATGKFYAQIEAGAPFDVLLAADQATPGKLVAEGKAVPATLHTYAIGKLVLWSADPGLVDGNGDVLKSDKWKHLSVADAKLAPYGQAAKETLAALKLTDAVRSRVVTAENIGQALQFVQTGNAELGFVALSQLTGRDAGSRWVVPQALYDPIRQDAVLLKSGAGNEAASAFIAFLRSPEARSIIERYGYVLDGQS